MGQSFSFRAWTVRARATVALVALTATTLVAVVGSPAAAATAFDFEVVYPSSAAQSGAPAVSADGRSVAFEIMDDIYVLDRSTGSTWRANEWSDEMGTGETRGDTVTRGPAISGVGQRVAFTRVAISETTGEATSSAVLFKDGPSPTGELYTIPESSGVGVSSVANDISADGSTIVWTTDRPVSEFLPGTFDTNGTTDVIRTRIAIDGTLTHDLISTDTDDSSTQNGASYDAATNADGSVVAFISTGTDVMTGPPIHNTLGNVWVGNGGAPVPITGITDRGTGAGAWLNHGPRLLTDDRVVFISEEPLVATDTNGEADVYAATFLGSEPTYERLSTGFEDQLYSPVVSMDVTAGASHLVFETADATVLDGVVSGTDRHVYRVELATGATELVTAADGTPHAGDHTDPVVSDDGSIVAFVSPDGLAAGDSDGVPDAVVASVVETVETSGPIELVSRDPSGFAGDGESLQPAVSHDGRFVAYTSRATDIAPGGEYAMPPARNIHVHDRSAGGTHTRKLMVTPTVNPNGDAYDPWISGDGRYVAFTTEASNLVAADPDNLADVIVWDTAVETDRFRVASVGNGGAVAEPATIAAMSDDGRYVLFATSAQVTTEDTNSVTDLYLRDLQNASTTLVSVRDGIVTQTWHSRHGDVSDAGVVTFSVGDMSSGSERSTVYVKDMLAAAADPVVLATDIPTFYPTPRISADGSTVVFKTNEVPGTPTFGNHQIVAFDRATGGYRLITHPATGSQHPSDGVFGETAVGWHNGPPSISPDGRFVAFESSSNDFVDTAGSGTDAHPDVFVHDVQTDTFRHFSWSSDTSEPRAARAPAVDATGTVVAWQDLNAAYFPAGANPDDNALTDVYLATYAAPVAGTPRTIDDVTLSVVPGKGGPQAGLDEVPIADIPVGSIPFASVAIGAAPLRSIDLDAAPLRSIPIRSIPLRSIPIRSITLSQLPLELEGGWAARLVGTTLEGAPLQTVTLAQVEAVAPATDDQGQPLPHPLDGVSLADVGIASTPLRSIGIASIALGSTPLRSIPIRSIDTGNSDPAQQVCPLSDDVPTTETQSLANWEALLACLGFSTTLDDGTSLVDIDIAGAPIRSIPIRSIPIRSIDLASAPIRSIPIRSIEISATPIRSIPIRSIELAPIPIRSIPIRSIPIRSIDTNVAVSPIRSIPIRSIPIRSIVVDCTDQRVDCSDLETNLQTLGDVADIDPALVLEGATLEDLGPVLEGYSFGDLMAFGDVTIGDVSDWLDQYPDIEISLADVLVGLLLKTDYPWHQLPVASMRLQNVNPTAEVVDVDLDFSVSGTSVPGSATTVTVTLPPGAAYAPGSSVAAEFSTARSPFGSVDDPSVNGSVLTYVLPGDFAGATNVSVSLAYRPGVRLVDEAVSATISISGDGAPLEAMVSSAPYGVVERYRSDDDPATAHELTAVDTLVVGHIAEPGDVDYYRIPASLVAGRRVSVDLDVPGVDQDLVLYSPVESAGVIDAAPIRSIPLRSIAVEDPGAVATGETVPPETLQDIPIRSIPIRSISANRDATDERVDVLANEDADGHYTIQVSGYNGASSPEPYVLRLRVTGPPAELECTPRSLPNAATSTATSTATATAPAPAGTDTLFIVNRSRIDATYGSGEAQRVVDALTTLGQAGVDGHVLAVDDDPGVRDAYAAWDAAPCSPNAANEVVDGIVGLIETSHASAGGGDTGHTIPFVVLVGADDVLPQARIPDLTRLSNERDYTPEVGDDNPLAGAFATEHLLSDDPYGDRDPVPWLNRLLYVPDAALGRLVETPDEIIAAVERFTAWDGSLDPSTATTSTAQTALVTGYDFLADGAEAVSDALAASLGTQPVELIDETWTRADLVDALLGADMPYVASVNAHFDHHRSLPALGNATHDESDLFTTADVVDPDGDPATAPPALDQRLLFSMGCHSGLNVPDVYVSGIEDDDWAQSFARQGVGAYVGNTGFGYGDTAAVALSERLMAEFAARMDGTMTVGQAMTYAKQAYASQLGVYGAYDEKVLAEATFYGLPMFTVKDQPTLPAPTSEVAVSAVAGAGPTVASSSFSLDAQDLAITSRTAPDGSTFLTSGGDAPQVTSGRPIVPRTDRDVTADTGVPARGVLLTGLTSSEQTGVRSTFARAIVDHSSQEPAIATDVAFPASFASVNRFRDVSGERSSLVLMPGQFVPDEDPATGGVGTQRRFTGMAGVVYYSDDDDVTAPTFSSTSARANATTATFTAEIADGDVLRVLVLYRDAGDAWRSAELAPAGVGTWTGAGPAASDEIEYLVQAVDTAGNVATTTNKGFLFAATADAVPPTVTVTSPTAGTYLVGATVPLTFECEDANLDDCTATLNGAPVASGGVVDTTEAGGFNELVVTATDRYGNTTTETVTFHIGYTFGGFAAPVAAGQRTEVKGGSAVPVRWQLTDADGYVSDRAAIVDIRSYEFDCGATSEATATLGTTTEVSGLKYDTETDEWMYVWKTERSWRSTCRQLVVSFADGQTASAVFVLK